jgi:glycosyltransferase involved in cell wall biosynthesis/SAM-dependent methyltransferase
VDVKVLIVSPYPPDRCGIASYTVQVAATLRRQGDSVEVISPLPSAAQHWADYSQSVRGVLQVLGRSRRADRTIVEFFPDLLFRSLRRSQFMRQWPIVALLFALGRKLELVVHEAPYSALKGRRDLRGRIARLMWRTLVTLPSATYVHTAWERTELSEAIGVDPHRIQLLSHGEAFLKRVEADRAQARRELGMADGEFHFLSIGFLQPHKGFDRAMAALTRLEGDHVRLDVVGSVRVASPEVDEHVHLLRRMADTTPRIRLHEWYVSDQMFDNWIVACDAVVLPYRAIWSSGVLERAKLYGRPAIVSDVGGMRDQSDENTRIVRDDRELRQAMAEVAGVGCSPSVAELEEPLAPNAEVVTYRDAMELVRLRARALRDRHEPGSSAAPALSPVPDRTRPPEQLSLAASPAGRGLRSRVKRIVSRLTGWQLVPIVRGINEVRDYVTDAVPDLQGTVSNVPVIHQDLVEFKQWVYGQIEDVRGALSWQQQLRGEDRTQLAVEIARLREASVQASPSGSPGPAADGVAGNHVSEARLAAFYEAHQARFRGSREVIRRRQEIYLPHVRVVARLGGPVLDIGSGRSEWLELLRENGIDAYGVDVNERFVEEAAAMGMTVRHQGGVEHLRGVETGSLAAVTAFHVVEHVQPESLIELVDESLRALKPGGLLVLETPNPLNIVVGASSFNLDPTHVRPIHPLFLEFVLENRGFTQVRTLQLHPPDEGPLEVWPTDRDALRRMVELLNRYFYAGQDFAVLGSRALVSEAPGPDGGRQLEPGAVQHEQRATVS